MSAKEQQAGADWLGKTLRAKQGLEDLMQSRCEGKKQAGEGTQNGHIADNRRPERKKKT